MHWFHRTLRTSLAWRASATGIEMLRDQGQFGFFEVCRWWTHCTSGSDLPKNCSGILRGKATMRVEIPFAAGKGVVQVAIWVSSKPPGLVLCNVEPPSLKASQNNLASCLARPLWSEKGHHSQTGPQSIYCPQQKMQKGSLFHPLASQACNWRPIEGNWHLETYTSSLRCLLFKATTNHDVRPRFRNTPTTSTLQCVQRTSERERERERGGKSQRWEEQKREDQRRERVRRKKMQVREKVGKTVFFQWLRRVEK